MTTTILTSTYSLLQHLRDFIEYFGTMNINGFPLDWIFHLIVAAGLMFIFTRVLSLKKSILIVCIFIFAKELIDIFAKSRAEYIVPPQIDTIKDTLSGLLGLFFYVRFAQFLRRKKVSPDI